MQQHCSNGQILVNSKLQKDNPEKCQEHRQMSMHSPVWTFPEQKKKLIDLFLEHLRMSVKDEKDLLSLLSRLFLFSYKTLNLDICLKLHFGLKSF